MCISQSKRLRLYIRDNYTCQYCSTKVIICPDSSKIFPKNAATLDHIIPRSKGGTDEDYNLITCCNKCNTILKNKGIKKDKITHSALIVYKNKRKIIYYTLGHSVNKTPKFLKEYHKELLSIST